MAPVNSATLKVCVEQKFDGISCSLQYRDGKLVQALSRGDGLAGEDMTAQVMVLKSIPKTITDLSTLWVRGELVMRKQELERINKAARITGGKEYSSTRNLTAGTMKLKDTSEVAKREILFMPWDIFAEDDDRLPDSNFERMQELETRGFPRYQGVLISDEADVVPAIDTMLLSNSQSDINADGVVIKVDSHSLRRKLGVASKYTNWMCCYKPQSASGTTYLRSIEWQVGRQGKLTPVATCDPVPLAGAMVTRATLNNITWIDAMGLRLGAKVEMLRSGDVIPQIIKVLDDGDAPIVPPSTCPECHTKLEVLDEERSGIITHWCQNYECAGRVRDLFTFVGSRDILEIDGLGPEMATKIVNDGYARDLGELFEFQFEALRGLATLGAEKFEKSMTKKGFSGVTFRKMIVSMEKAKTAPWERWIACLGIPMIGRTLGKVLASALNLDGESMYKLPELLASLSAGQVEGIGEVKLDMIQSWAKEARNQEICIVLYKSAIRPTNTAPKAAAGDGPKPLTGTAFCITGEFTEDRGKITEKLVSLGAVSKSGVTSKCNLLIVGEGAGKTKLTKANQLGIKQVGKEWLVTTLTENGMELKGNGGFEPEEA
jgi:DNA ligase (NAD+)